MQNNDIETKKKNTLGLRRIQRSSDKEEIIKLLMSNQVGIFNEIWRLMLFAAQIGMSNSRREALASVDTGKGIDQSTFGNCPAWPGVFYLMALVESNDSNCLSGNSDTEDQRVTIFQEYVNGGLGILESFFADRPVNLDGVIAFIETQKRDIVGSPDLDLSI